ncbi:MAG: amidohydrolase [Acidobacteriaceae bacterium]
MRLYFALLLATAALAQPPAPAPTADTIFIHGDVLTGAHLLPNDPDPTPARVTAIAVRNGTIVAVGSDAEILKLKSADTRIVDLGGAFAMPGFNDAHVHMASAGQRKLTVNLTGTTSLADMLARIRAYAAAVPQAQPNSWLQGSGWDHTAWPGKTLPTRTDLDAVTGSHPAIFTRIDGHIAVANSSALAAANISAATPDPPGGRFDRDASGNPTGIVREGPAIALIDAKIPPISEEDRHRALSFAIADALANGVTSVQDFSDWDDFLVLLTLEDTHKLHLRVSEWVDFNLPLAILEERRASHDPNDPLLHIGMLKGFMDGSLGSRTAAMAEPYADDPGNSGIPRYDQDKLNQMAAERAAAGFQLGFHAIGDQANHMALNAFSAAEQVAVPANVRAPRSPGAAIVTQSAAATTPASFRLRIEHAQVLLPADFDRFASLGVIASMQPSHLLTDMNWAAARIGPGREPYSYAWRSMLDHHVTLAFGTDYPVESINPFRGLYAAITRQNEAGTATYQPQEKITLAEAIYAYTQASAFAEFRERSKGRLEPGYLADLVVLDRDITKSTPQQLLHTRVLRTIVNGDTVYTAGAP